MKTTVSIVIPVWNGRDLLSKNLPSIIEAAEYKQNRITEIILVDDKSTDNTVSFLKANFEQVKIVCHKVNRGFGATVNTGFRSASGNLVCLLNQDVSVEKDFLVAVLPHFEDQKTFGVSLHELGFPFTKGIFSNGFITHKPAGESKKTSSAFWISGGSGVINRKIWMSLGGFDEVLAPFYWEDVDISYRALKRGYKLLWEPKAHVVHQHEAVINNNNFRKWWLTLIKERNYLIFNWKNLTSHNLFRKHLKGLLRRVLTHPGYTKVVLLALLRIQGIIKSRNKEKREAVLSDEAIFSSFE